MLRPRLRLLACCAASGLVLSALPAPALAQPETPALHAAGNAAAGASAIEVQAPVTAAELTTLV